MLDDLGLPASIDDPSVAAATLQKARVCDSERNGSDDESDVEAKFIPDACGYALTLVDGTTSRLRFRKELCEDQTTLIPEYRVANREILMNKDVSLSAMARRVLDDFNDNHMELPWSAEA